MGNFVQLSSCSDADPPSFRISKLRTLQTENVCKEGLAYLAVQGPLNGGVSKGGAFPIWVHPDLSLLSFWGLS